MVGGHRNQPLHVRVAADDTVQRHDIRRCNRRSQGDEIALQKSDAAGVPAPRRFFFRGPDENVYVMQQDSRPDAP